jgi:hypothetical protein
MNPETAMSAQPKIITVFGSYVPESHHDGPLPGPKPAIRKPATRKRGPLLILLIAVLLGATIPALAFTAVKQLHTTTRHVRWQQQEPAYFLKVPPNVGFDPALF